MPNFSPNEFSKLVIQGIESIRYRRKIKTQGKVYNLICQQISSLTPDVLRNWTRSRACYALSSISSG